VEWGSSSLQAQRMRRRRAESLSLPENTADKSFLNGTDDREY